MIDFENIDSNCNSYNFLIEFYQQNRNKTFQAIDISFRKVDWIAANTCSIIGAVFQKIQNSFNKIRLFDIKPKVQTILERNAFLSFLGYPRVPDNFHTTIEYLKLSPNQGRFFNDYIQKELLGKQGMPTMSKRLKKKIGEGIYEIFINAAMHSETIEGIFTCGQLFPGKHKIEFTVTDLGIGIRNRVNQYLGESLSSVNAIEWAMLERNTTKPNDSGGLGLAILKQFISLNKGSIQVISNDGFWEFSDKGTVKYSFHGEFPGTAVNICINTDDPMHYSLYENAISDEDIF